MPETVFYSWQSDLPNKTNRSLIESALTRALQSIVDDVHLQAAPRLDQDTRGVPGSPDIASTILSKIDAASAFVGDVSLVTESEADRPSPNPNVLIELGYALKALGPSRVVIVFNERFGKVEDLPFDLRLKPTLSYSLGEDSEPKEARDKLQSLLENALRLIFESSRESARARQLSGYVSNVIPELISFLMLGNQMAERDLNPWFDTAQSQFESNARTIRDLAIREEAPSVSLMNLDSLLHSSMRSSITEVQWANRTGPSILLRQRQQRTLHRTCCIRF
ncbi:MAG: nucleotide-binding protein [Acidobacteria bacterium]|nr:nucleotide-binding protein [Verrucomicrobiales bacterium]MCI0722555.1 nucleotide-binding protein [Acidobacteriota bacterium]